MKALSRFVSTFDRGALARIAYKASIDAAGKVAMLVMSVAAARTLPRDAFGLFALALTSGWLLGVATDAGIPIYLARSAARAPRRLAATLAVAVRLRLLLAFVALVAAVLVGWRWTPPAMRLPFALIVMSQLASATLETIGHALRGIGRSELEAHVHFGQRVAVTASALLVLGTAPSIIGLAWAMLLPPLLAMPVMIALARRSAQAQAASIHFWPATLTSQAPSRLVHLARAAAPLGAGVLLSALYFRIDLFFVEYWHGLETVAGYSAVFRIVEGIRLAPAAVLAVTFPILCRATDAAALLRVATWLTAAGVVAAIAIGVAAPTLVVGLYGGAYLDAVPALRTLALAVPLFFLNYALTHQVIGWDGQGAFLAIAATALGANLAANGALVPRYGATGAAAATGLTEVVVTVGCWWALTGVRRARQTEHVATEGVS
ncbi:MAG: polysaccharide biosynthesis C-terminal domain-containing protein [Acidobacteria bacterium]|nr:polysaccharide biosynthesis C-terminal domain-containing protein [Acidobacteriota bacterium]